MSAEDELPDPDLPQDPGIPGPKDPEQLPPQEEPEVDDVPESGHAEVDDEGHRAPPPSDAESNAPEQTTRVASRGPRSR